LLQAARFVEPYCDAVDINLGCPQRKAKDSNFGAYLLPRPHWKLVQSLGTISNPLQPIPRRVALVAH